MTEDRSERIREMRDQGLTWRQIGDEMGLSPNYCRVLALRSTAREVFIGESEPEPVVEPAPAPPPPVVEPEPQPVEPQRDVYLSDPEELKQVYADIIVCRMLQKPIPRHLAINDNLAFTNMTRVRVIMQIMREENATLEQAREYALRSIQ